MTSLPKPLFSGSRKYPYLYHGQHLQSLKGEGEGCPQTGIQRAWGTHWTGIPGVGDFSGLDFQRGNTGSQIEPFA